MERVIEITKRVGIILNQVHKSQYSYQFWAFLLVGSIKSIVQELNKRSDGIITDYPRTFDEKVITYKEKTSWRNVIKQFICLETANTLTIDRPGC